MGNQNEGLPKGIKIGLIALLSVFFLSIILLGTIFAMTSKNDIYKTQETTLAKDVLSKEGKNIYYFYQPTCAHCEDAKPNITRFVNELNKKGDIKFNLVNMADPKNADYWYKGEDSTTDPDYKSLPAEIKSSEDVAITGTPTMIYSEGNEVLSAQIGNGMYSVMNQALKDDGSSLLLTP